MDGKKIKKLIIDKVWLYLLIFFGFIYLTFNIVSSQTVSSLYFPFIGDDKKSAVLFLQKIKLLTIFPGELTKYQQIYGEQIKQDVFRPDLEKTAQINKFEQILSRNQSSRDVLYSLYILNMEKGDNIKAMEFLKRAENIDPTLLK